MTNRRSAHAPRYLQIADDLKARIASLNPGTRLPSEPQLAKEFAVSRFTVARAVEQLTDEGLITRRQGSGTFVAEAPLRRAPGYLLSFTEAVEAAGHSATHRLLEFVPAVWERGLPYSRDEQLLSLDRLRLVDGMAVARHRSVLSRHLVERIDLTRDVAAHPDFSLYRHFEDRGLLVHSATERLIACTASDEDRTLLGLARGSVVVAVTRHSFAADGTVLDCVSAIYDARRYSYEARLLRQHPSGNNNKRNQENDNDPQLHVRDSHSGPRLGPWDDGGAGG
ncbi:GntR family transcriptional regulator [Mesorhizobium sp. CAU 1732]|uniref:GntR family transcriptional regulator n=1 Tax=Mesorhizobium sp. CAU 1732 TaxID=3140358 RepID=UPI00326109E4